MVRIGMANGITPRPRRGALAALATLATGLLVLGAAPAAATPQPDRVPVKAERIDGSDGPAGANTALGCKVTAFGYVGYRKCDTVPLWCDFTFDGFADEVWVISDSRRIWHAWHGSGGWREMPNNGRADETYDCYWSHNGHRVVEVYVNGSGRWWSWRDNDGVWEGWYPA